MSVSLKRSHRSAGFKCSPKIPERDHKSHCFSRAGIEAERDVESPRLFRDSVDNDPPNPDDIGRLSDAPRRIAKHCPPQPASLVIAIHRQPGQDHDRDRIRHVSPELPRNAGLCDGAGGEGVIAGDVLAFTYCVSPGCATSLIRQCAAFKPVIQYRLARIEAVNLMIVSQRFGRRKRRAHSQGAGVCMLLSSRLFGCGGAFRRARN